MSQELLFAGEIMEETPQSEQQGKGTNRQRHRLKKTEDYRPNYTILEAVVPEGLLTKAKAMVSTSQRGHKATLRNLRSIEFHRGMQSEHSKLAEYHALHNEMLLNKLGVNVGDIARTKSGDQAIRNFLESLNDGALDSVAQSKNVSMDLLRDDMIHELIKVWNQPVGETAQAS